jgi:hypothetical protein
VLNKKSEIPPLPPGVEFIDKKKMDEVEKKKKMDEAKKKKDSSSG